MKNQYFGDINDYMKYGLLRLLSHQNEMKTAICWMLTPDDGRTDGRLTSYLNKPEKWRQYAPGLYDALKNLIVTKEMRNVQMAESPAILTAAYFHSEFVPDDVISRIRYFEVLGNKASGCNLLFFDPDNGIEVESKPYGHKGSAKYIYLRELTTSYSDGHSLLIYQHFPRIKRDQYIKKLILKLSKNMGAEIVYSFRTPRVLFLLIPQKKHKEYFHSRCRKIENKWKPHIQVEMHRLT